jgi:DNA primase
LSQLQIFLGWLNNSLQETNSASYSLRTGFSNEVSLGVPLHLKKKKVRDGCALPGAGMQKSYAPKCGQRKTKIDLFWDFVQKSPISKL